jgi:uncharacterized MAPEG superfamily protein
MTIILYCALAMVLLPYLAKIPVAFAQQKAGGYDNHLPRQQQATLTGLGARAVAAHQNSFEALIVFSVVLSAVLFSGKTDETIQTLFIVHVVCRALYCVLYWVDIATLRSVVWVIGLGCMVSALLSCI